METTTDSEAPVTASRRRRVLFFMLGAAVLVLAVVMTFQYVIFTDSTQLSGLYDVHRYFGPLAYYLDYCLHAGEFPFWNPVTYCGMPYAANPQVAAYYPPNLLRSALTFSPTPYRTQFGLVVLMGLHLLLAGWGTWLLARSHKISRSGSWAAVLAFTFSALMVRRVCEYHFVYTLNWLPLLLFLAKQLLDAFTWRRKLYWALAAGLVFGMSVLGGFFQIVNYMAVTLAGYALLYRLLHPRTSAGLRGRPLLRAWLSDGIALWAVLAVMALIGFALLFPAMELAKYSGRQPGVAVPMYSNLYERVGIPILQDALVYPGIKYHAEALRGSGVAALVLALAALFTARRRETILFAGVFLILLDCSFGPPLPFSWLVSKITPFSPSAYSRAYDLALLPLSMLAGLGVDGLLRQKGRRWAAWLEGLLVAGLGAGLLYTLWQWIQPTHYLQVSHWVVTLPAVAVAVMVIMRLFRRAGPRLAFLLPLLLFFETLSWNVRYVPMMTHQQVTPLPAVVATMPQDNHRRTDDKANRQLFQMHHLFNGYDPLNLSRTWKALVDPTMENKYSRMARQLSVTAGNQRGNLLFKRSFWLARQWVKGPLPSKEDLFPAATTVFLRDGGATGAPEVTAASLKNTGISDNAIVRSFQEPSLVVPIRAGTKARRFLKIELPEAASGRAAGPAGAVHSVIRLHYRSTCPVTIEPLFRDRASTQAEFGKKTQRPSAADAVLELPLPDYKDMDALFSINTLGRTGQFEFTGAEVLSDADDEDGLIKIRSRRANQVDLTVGPLDGPRLLTYLDADYPGWHAWVDGLPAPILLADDGFKAISLSPGEHQIRFAFHSIRAYAGLGVSVATALLALLLLIRFRPAERNNGGGPYTPVSLRKTDG